jgi:hypothetical protein
MASPFDIIGEVVGTILNLIVETVTGKAAKKTPMSKKAAWILVIFGFAFFLAIPYLKNLF